MILLIAVVAIVVLAAVVFVVTSGGKKAFGDGKKPKTLQLPISKKEYISHDTIFVKLALPSSSDILGLDCGKHFTVSGKINGEFVSRAYTPTSDGMRQKGSIDLVIKVYKPTERFPKGGIMSQYIDSLKIGQKVRIRGPFGKIHYRGNGHFDISKGKQTEITKSIGMICGGTGITPMLQIINEVLVRADDKTEMYLLFANKTEDDILVRSELEAAEKKAKEMGKKFKLWYTLDKAPEDWKYSEGFVNKDMIAKTMPSPGDNPVMLFCGPPVMYERAVKPNLIELKYNMNRSLNF
mmetsp:Transcript_15889/g.23944  ORF Transcript_15889/g.23944 Transcript_15889/m.23944 type:complete len:294 (-) Transcript_15889:180-1061(-)